ncbi:2-polyprenylphenol 6-hydroxylase [Candidatus Legionella polyplacis]|uniref:2-polyprenylphenol 6-hydroxylase n=1 Tax=Candidatus Legionella polyplacis TaxID=2005262 RepID=A0ABZ2H0V2_9GAMM
MNKIKQLIRIIYIYKIILKNNLDQIILSLNFFSSFKFIIYLNPWIWFKKKPINRGKSIRKALETLGPVFIKLGQILSMRSDIFPQDIITELYKLQDKVPPFPGEHALSIIETSFKQPVHKIFSKFNINPIASASIAQVHIAKLKNGKEVAVKILRPNIKKIIEQDINIIFNTIKIFNFFYKKIKWLNLKEIIDSIKKNFSYELNLKYEAANASKLKQNFKNSNYLYIPKIFWDYTKENILVMERIYGIPISNIDKLINNKIDLKKIAKIGLKIFFTQIFRDCFFHADMHPGNIFISTLYSKNHEPKYVLIDFGIIGTINDHDKTYLIENLHAFINKDYQKIVRLHIESGWIPIETSQEELENSIRIIFEPIFKKTIKDIKISEILLHILEIANAFKIKILPQLILLQKTLFSIEGLIRQLYPELNFLNTLKPLLEKWIKEQIGIKSFIKKIKKKITSLNKKVPYIPDLIYDTLQLIKEKEIKNNTKKADQKNILHIKNFLLKKIKITYILLIIIIIFYLK